MPPHRDIFESTHDAASVLRYHTHGIAFATIVLQGSYTEVRECTPNTYGAGSIVVHAPTEEHADYFTSVGRCLNVELEEAVAPGAAEPIALDVPLRRAVEDVVRAFYACPTPLVLGGTVSRLRAALRARRNAKPLVPDWLTLTVERWLVHR